MLPALRTMRIIAVPLTRPTARVQSLTGSKLNRLTYYQFQISAKTPKKPPSSPAAHKGGESGTIRQKKNGWLPEEGVVNWATQKAADIWAGFGKSKGGWKLKTYQFGEKLVDRMEFEELALKSFDPSLGPSILHLKRSPVLDEKESTTIPLIFPPSVLSPSVALSDLRAFVELRVSRHRKGFYLWMGLAPFTAPFMIIPIIPNLPFFFCVWRSWSHYRAYKSSQYLQSLLEHNLIIPQPSEALDQVYKTYKISPPHDSSSKTSSASSTIAESTPTDNATSLASASFDPHSIPRSSELHHTLLLKREAVPAILSMLELPPDSTVATELYRAIEQAQARISTGSSELGQP